jgi:hypothetical protein
MILITFSSFGNDKNATHTHFYLKTQAKQVGRPADGAFRIGDGSRAKSYYARWVYFFTSH